MFECFFVYSQILVGLCLITPCLAFIFANVFVLFIPWGPPPTNGTNATTTTTTAAPPLVDQNATTETNITTRSGPPRVMNRTVFTSW